MKSAPDPAALGQALNRFKNEVEEAVRARLAELEGPRGAVVAMSSGWDSRVGDTDAYLNVGPDGKQHFPGFGKDAVEWLIARRDIAAIVSDLRARVAANVKFEPGTSIAFSGQFEYLERANARLRIVVPATLAIIFVLLYLTFRRFDEAALIMLTLPFALTGGVWLLYALGYNLSIATAVGFIALAGVAAETGVVMLIYLDHALKELQARRSAEGRPFTREDLHAAIMTGAVERVRPKMMTVAAIMAGLLPIMWSHGTGAEVMQPIAVPMIGGMVSSTLLTLIVIPAVYAVVKGVTTRS